MAYHDPTSFSDGAAVLDERRAFPRFQVALHGVCSIADGEDQPCKVVDLSLGGARIAFSGACARDVKASLLLPHLGLLSARVARVTDDGFAVEFTGGAAQRRRIQDYLVFTLLLQDDQANEDRAFDRILPLRRTVEVRRDDGRAHMARIRDVSRSGVALTTTVAMAIGEGIVVGDTAAEVVRVFDGGAAARFRALLPPTFDPTVTL